MPRKRDGRIGEYQRGAGVCNRLAPERSLWPACYTFAQGFRRRMGGLLRARLR
jgi:hypothetical protein